MKRKPKVYLGGSINDNMVQWWKDTIMEPDYGVYPVEFLDPVRHNLSSITDNELIVKVNTEDIQICDLICIYFHDNITAGASIELYLSVSILRKPAMVFTEILKGDITPYVRNLCSHRIYKPANTIKVLEKWLKIWYESA